MGTLIRKSMWSSFSFAVHDSFRVYKSHSQLNVSAYSVFLDFLLSLLPWKIIWPLHLSTKDRIGICVAMSMGFGAGATGIVKIFHLFSFNPLDNNKLGGLFIWESAEIAATIIAASIPVLRKLSLSRRRHNIAPNMRENQEEAMRSSFRRQLRMVGLVSQVTENTNTTQAAPSTILGSTQEEANVV
ncbi:hypothetical protein CMEL01_11545 [Colletotrichum melonis]|uniref:Rhodopsin domain-containing protein n=1 Tax=Colletotrichum melonis TaxID=1209925 RepID=A0AAI9XWD8_9PEZI|nr:hypothetical protein CMEL01_11545 [Colletotrichum melonis]